MLIDHYIPEGHFRSRHRTTVRAERATVYRCLLDVDLGRSPGVRLLFRLRGMPASTMTLAGLERVRFARLAEEPGEEIVLGLIGRFWTWRGDLRSTGPQHFREFDEPGYAKAVWGFALADTEDGATVLSTETRVRCTDPVSCGKFRWYWRVVSPFSRWMRREALRMVREDAERAGIGAGGGGSRTDGGMPEAREAKG